jgi:hypothetical protein
MRRAVAIERMGRMMVLPFGLRNCRGVACSDYRRTRSQNLIQDVSSVFPNNYREITIHNQDSEPRSVEHGGIAPSLGSGDADAGACAYRTRLESSAEQANTLELSLRLFAAVPRVVRPITTVTPGSTAGGLSGQRYRLRRHPRVATRHLRSPPQAARAAGPQQGAAAPLAQGGPVGRTVALPAATPGSPGPPSPRLTRLLYGTGVAVLAAGRWWPRGTMWAPPVA